MSRMSNASSQRQQKITNFFLTVKNTDRWMRSEQSRLFSGSQLSISSPCPFHLMRNSRGFPLGNLTSRTFPTSYLPSSSSLLFFSANCASRTWIKELESLQQTLCNLFIFATRCRRPLIFQIINSVRSKSLSLKYQRFATSSCKDV